MDADELYLLRTSLRAALATARDVDAVLDELGADEMLADGAAATAVVFEELGRARRPSGLLNQVLARALGLGSASVALPLPRAGSSPDRSAGALTADGLAISGILLAPGAQPEELAVAGSGPSSALYLVPAAKLDVAIAGGLDPSAGARRVTGLVAIADARTVQASTSWAAALAAGRSALAAELRGLTCQIRDVAVEHVTARHQFGRALGSFQAVRHRLAEAHVEINAAEALATLAESGGGDDALIWSMALKASAGRAFEVTARNAVQACGAMGLTAEHELHRYVRRGAVLNGLLGDCAELSRNLGELILSGATMPSFDPLVAAE